MTRKHPSQQPLKPTRPLVEVLKGLIERSYGMPRVIGDLTPFSVGGSGFRALYGGRSGTHSEGGDGARVLVRDSGRGLRVSLYYPDALVSHLEIHNPLAGVGDINI